MSPSPLHPLQVLHVGVANRGQWPLKFCNETTGLVPAALCDVHADALEQARVQTGLSPSACFTDIDEAIRKSNADCAIVCTPTVYHVPIALKMIDAGIPVLIEKGMAPDWAAALRLTLAAREKKALFAVAQNYRYRSLEKTIWKAIHDPTFDAYLGEVHHLSYAEQRVRPIPYSLTYPFASIWDMSCHHLDNLLHWLGPIADVTAFGWRAKWSAYAHACNTSAHLTYRNGTHVHYVHTHDAARQSVSIEVHGEKGALCFSGDRLSFNERPLEQFGSRPILPVPMLDSDNEGDVLRDFRKYIVEGIEPGISAGNNLFTMASCEMMVRSITQNRTVSFDELENTP